MGIIVAVVAAFIVDYAVLRAKMMFPKLGAATGTVQILYSALYVIAQKNGRVHR